MDVGFEFELLPGRFWNSKNSHRGFAFLSLNKTTMCGVFFRIERGECLGFWVLISQVLMNLRVLLCLRKFGRFVPLVQRSSLSFANVPLFIEKRFGS